ncbi:MAG: carbohydrate kinase [Candidatus Aminicenantes bacterium]|nr:carbohydrate kinase [Candidatus Aminicenantes bacterium]
MYSAKEKQKEQKREDDKKIVVGIGEVVWDIFPDGAYMGGAPANFVYYAQLHGFQSYLVSRVGDDELGRETIKRFSSHQLPTDYIQVDRIHPTGTVKVRLDANKVPTFTIEENAAWDFLERNESLQQLAKKAEAICFGSLAFRSVVTGETINCFLDQASPDCLLVLDINLRAPFFSPELIKKLLEKADVLKLNEGELDIIAGYFYPDLKEELPLCRRLIQDYQLALVALTKGEKGSWLVTSKQESYHPAFPVTVVDTVGAGDAFTSVLVAGLLKGQSLEEINKQANWVASRVCAEKGAWVEL